MNPDLIDLTKKVDTVLNLRKMDNVHAQVCLAIDYSGSMSNLYRNGTVQKAVNRLSAVAVKLDDNGELDVLVFDDGVREAEAATPDLFGNYVSKCILAKGWNMGGTNYAPFIRKAVENYFTSTVVTEMREVVDTVVKASKGFFGAIKDAVFGKETETVTRQVEAQRSVSSSSTKSGLPVLMIIITDGENYDQAETSALLNQMQDKNAYWQFVGIGNTDFGYLQRLSKQLPNVGFFNIDNLETVKDMELYKQLLSEEFATWVKKF